MDYIEIGKVTRERLYLIKYEDGDSEQNVDPENVRALEGDDDDDRRPSSPSKRPKTFSGGDTVQAKYKGGRKWYKGKITYVNENRRGEIEGYEIKYEDDNRVRGRCVGY